LRREDLAGRRPEARSHDHLEEDPREAVRGRVVDLAGQRDHAAEAGDGIASEARLPGFEERRPFRGAARVRVLDDHAGRSLELPHDRGGGRRVWDVVVRELLALERFGPGRERTFVGSRPGATVAGGGLMRVLAVAQRLDLLEADREARRERVVVAGEAGLSRELD